MISLSESPPISPYESHSGGSEVDFQPDSGPLAVALFHHINFGPEKLAGYAEVTDRDHLQMVQNYQETLQVFEAHPQARVFTEASGTSLLSLRCCYPQITESLTHLADSGVAVPVLGTYSNPLAPTTRSDHMLLQLHWAYQESQKVFPSLKTSNMPVYLQEFFYHPHMLGLFDRLQTPIFIGWMEHLAQNMGQEFQEAYRAGGFVNPLHLSNSRTPTTIVPISGHWIHTMRHFAQERPSDPQAYLEQLHRVLPYARPNSLMLLGPSDAEYVGHYTPLSDGWTIAPKWLDKLLYLIEQSDDFYFPTDPLGQVASGQYDEINLAEGGSRENLSVWQSDPRSQFLDQFCQKALCLLDETLTLIHQSNPDLSVITLPLFGTAVEAYELSLTSDARGYNPIQARRDAALNHALEAIQLCQSIQALYKHQ